MKIRPLQNFINRIVSPKPTKQVDDNSYFVQQTMQLNKLNEDVFCKNLPKLEEELIEIEDLSISRRALIDAAYKHKTEEHPKRIEKYGSNLINPPREVSEEEFDAINAVQYCHTSYTAVQKKLRNHKALNEEEKKSFEKILNAMQPTKEEMIVWRSLTSYEGFIDSINKGYLDLEGFSSTSACFDDFFAFWGGPGFEVKDNKTYLKNSYFLKIIIPKNTPILDCNATYGKLSTRLPQEIVLLPAHCTVQDIDIENKVITLLYKEILEPIQ